MTEPNQTVPIIEIQDMTKVYQMGDIEVRALRGVSLTVQPGEYVAVVGTSGSGKSTLMNMIGLLDRPTNGTYKIRGTESSQLSKSALADLRNREIGFVFQRFNLLARVNARRQVELPLFYAGLSGSQSRQQATAALERVGLGAVAPRPCSRCLSIMVPVLIPTGQASAHSPSLAQVSTP